MDRTENDGDLDVQLDIFSGRPNPRWTLSGPAAERMREMMSVQESAKPHDPPALGYRGFLIDVPAVRVVRAYDGVLAVLSSRDREPTYYRDANGVEEQLLAQARDLGYGDVIEAFRNTEPMGAP